METRRGKITVQRERENSLNKKDYEFSMLYYKFNSLAYDLLQRRNKSTFIPKGWWAESRSPSSPPMNQLTIITAYNAPAAIDRVVHDLLGSCWLTRITTQIRSYHPSRDCWEYEEYICESLNWITARSVDRINWMMVGVCSPSIGDERGIFTCSIPTSNEWDIQV